MTDLSRTIDLSTTSDTFCFTNDPNVSIETATHNITGGTGPFSAATGTAASQMTVSHPPARRVRARSRQRSPTNATNPVPLRGRFCDEPPAYLPSTWPR